MIEGNYSGIGSELYHQARGNVRYKIMGENQFAIIEMDPDKSTSRVFGALGSYTYLDSLYIEKYAASNLPGRMNNELTFRSELKGNTWTIQYKDDKMSIKETWVCVKSLPEKE